MIPLRRPFHWLLIGTAVLALGACGSRKDLRPVAANQSPPTPYGAKAPPTAKKLLSTPTEARPSRSDDALSDSHERQPDPYDLPPTG